MKNLFLITILLFCGFLAVGQNQPDVTVNSPNAQKVKHTNGLKLSYFIIKNLDI